MRAKGLIKICFYASVPFFIQACAATPTFSSRPASTANTNTSSPDPDTQVGIGQPGPEFQYRQYTFASNSQIDRPVVKVALIIDNSSSMLDEQSVLATGISQLLNQLEGKELNLDFYIYTTTQLANSSQKPMASTKTYYRYQNEQGELVETTSPERLVTQLPVTRRFNHELNATLTPMGEALSIRVDTSTMDFLEIKTQLQNIISQIGTSGSNEELGLCGIGRLLLGNAPAENKVFNEGDFAAFLVISDSNDSASDDSCLAYEEQDFGTVTPENQSSVALVTTNSRLEANRWIYNVQFVRAFNNNLRVRYRYNGFCNIDGQARPCILNQDRYYSSSDSVSWNYPAAFGELNSANGSTSACSPEIQEWMEQNHPRDYRQGECSTLFYRSSFNRTYTDFSSIDSNLCASAFGSYANLHDYYRQTENIDDTWNNGNCSGSGRMYPSYAGISSIRKVSVRNLLAPEAPNLREAIMTKANQLFGENGFVFSAIVSDPNSEISCAQPAEAHGTQYLQLAEALGDQGSNYPICSEDYYPALSPVESFINQIVATSYQPPLADNEQILSVKRIRNGVKISLEAGVDYNIQGKSIRFSENVLQPEDQVELEIRAEMIPEIPDSSMDPTNLPES